MRTPLHRAVICSQEGCINELLTHNVDINAQDSKGRTALHLAVEAKQIPFVKILLMHGASCDIQNLNGKTVKDIAEMSGYDYELVDLLNKYSCVGRCTKPARRE